MSVLPDRLLETRAGDPHAVKGLQGWHMSRVNQSWDRCPARKVLSAIESNVTALLQCRRLEDTASFELS
jgi:hypothetical protein